MALHHLSDMTMEELDDFVHTNGENMRLSPADVIALHLRRQRRAYFFGRERPPSIDHNPSNNNNNNASEHFSEKSLRLLLLGEETEAKLGLAALLYGDRYISQGPMLLELGFAEDGVVDGNRVQNINTNNNNNAVDPPRLEVLVPSEAEVTASLRGELCLASDVILMCFSITDRGTFEALRQRWWKGEVMRAFKVLAQDIADAHRSVTWPITPVIVVGLAAEARQEPPKKHSLLVSHTEAVQLAQEMGASKYMEICSDSVHHALCLVTQCTQVTHALHESLSSTAAKLFLVSAKQHMLRCYLRVPKPEGTLDVQMMQLRVRVTLGIKYVFTDDGTDPRRYSSHTSFLQVPDDGVIDLRPYRNRPGTMLRICGKARCAYTSTVLEVEVPGTVVPPNGYFDPVWKRFVLMTTPDDASFSRHEIRYTLDGTKPTTTSLPYIDPIELDVMTSADSPWRPWRGSVPPPRVIRLSVFANEEFSSPTVAYEVPTVLDTPKIIYSARDSTICLESTHPMVEYRYTLDGTTPTHMSTLYTGPLSLNSDATRQVRFVAFPKVFFPSREAVFYVPTATTSTTRAEDHSLRSFHMTRAAMIRGQYTTQKMHSDSMNGNSSGNVFISTNSNKLKRTTSKEGEHLRITVKSPASSLRAVSPMLRTETRAARARSRSRTGAVRDVAEKLQTSQREGTPRHLRSCARPTRTRTTTPTPPGRSQRLYNTVIYNTDDDDDDLPLLMAKNMGEKESFLVKAKGKWAGDSKSNRKRKEDDSKITNSGPLCTADDNTVVFNFPEPISLSYITVMTPGGGAGPTVYEVEVKHAHGTDFLSVGSGEFQDVRGVQKLKVMSNASLFPVDRVRCVFSGGPTGFRVKDLKVHGKPFK